MRQSARAPQSTPVTDGASSNRLAERRARLHAACARLASRSSVPAGWPVAAGDEQALAERAVCWTGLALPLGADRLLAASPLPPDWFAATAIIGGRVLHQRPWSVAPEVDWRAVVWVALTCLSTSGELPAPVAAARMLRRQRHTALGGLPEGHWRRTLLQVLLPGRQLDDDVPDVGEERLRLPAETVELWRRAGLVGVPDRAYAWPVAFRIWPVFQDVRLLTTMPETGSSLITERILPAAALAGGDPYLVRTVLEQRLDLRLATAWAGVPLPGPRRVLLSAAGVSVDQALTPQWRDVPDLSLQVVAALQPGHNGR